MNNRINNRINVTVDEQTYKQLTVLAQTYGYRGPATVAAKIINHYIKP